jgi:predicted HTH domain antitoxin
MKVVKLKDDIYKKAEKVSRTYGIEVNTLISQALNQGLEVISEDTVLGLYRDRKITLQKAAEMLSLSIWDMIEKLKEADIHINYSRDELAEDLK